MEWQSVLIICVFVLVLIGVAVWGYVNFEDEIKCQIHSLSLTMGSKEETDEEKEKYKDC